MRYAFLYPSIMGLKEGMGRDLVERWPVARATFEEANDVLGYDFMTRCFTSTLPELSDGNYMRLLATLVVGVAARRVLAEAGIEPAIVTGMSSGLFPSLVTAHCVTFADVLVLLRRRSELFDAIPQERLGMVLLVITANEKVRAQVEEIGRDEDVPIALYNNSIQISFAGSVEEIERMRARLKKVRGVFLPKLDRFGILLANHSRLFAFIVEPWREIVKTLPLREATLPIALSGSQEITTDQQRIYDALVEFDVRPSYWWQTFSMLVKQGYDLFLELGVNHTLANMARADGDPAVIVPCASVAGIEMTLSHIQKLESQTAALQ